MSNNFSNFTNLYSLSKTLRFELRPVGNTQNMLEENLIFQTDENRKIAYEKTKPYFDRLHREFIDESLKEAKLPYLDKYYLAYKANRRTGKNSDTQKALKKLKDRLRKEVTMFFDAKGKEWANEKYSHLNIKKKDLNILFEEQVFQILKERYGNEKGTQLMDEESGEEISIFDGWKGFTGYFTKFFETRKNFYKNGGKSSALATRMIDQNLDRFLDNLMVWSSVQVKIDVAEIEEFFDLKTSDVFQVEFYNSCLLQRGIDRYNEFLGGKTLENGEKIMSVNEIINKYRQDNPGEKLPYLKKLDKQILSEKEKFIDEIETPEKLLEALRDFYNSAQTKITIIKTLLDDFYSKTSKYDLAGVYLSKEALNTISHKWTTETENFNENLFIILKDAKVVRSSVKKQDGGYSFPDFISLAHIKSALERVSNDVIFWKERYYSSGVLGANGVNSKWEEFLLIFEYEFLSNFRRTTIDKETGEEYEAGYDIFKPKLESLLTDFSINPETKVVIKNFADEVLHIYQMGKYFALEKRRNWVTEYDSSLDLFYTDPDIGYLQFYENAFEEIVQPYNKIRNYLTKKPYSEEKWKLNFDNPTLANGWDKNKESDNAAIILRKDGKYYLGIMKKGHSKIFDDRNEQYFTVQDGEEVYKKLVYKLFPDPSRMMPKVCFSKKGLEFFNPSDVVLQIYNNNEFKKGDSFSLKSMQSLISFYIDCLKLYPGWQHYDFRYVKEPYEYVTNIGEFYADVAKSGYKLWFEDITENYVLEKNNSGELFLFQIYNKDFSDKSTGAKNLHTLYFEELFSQANIDNNFPFKLNGQAELFYRPKSISAAIEKRNFKRDIVSKKRYSENKVFFHVPITLNRTPKNVYRFNTEVNNFLANNPDINIIGVDRGEKHLAYYSVINQKGELLESGSLNTINGVDYHHKLAKRAKEREQARKDWQDVEKIKDLKMGYISQVVRKLADLAIKHNAIIVMEDLNMRFKQIRGGIEKSVYQQLEKALIEKLNFLVNKGETDPDKAGHLLEAYQLTAPFETFKNMGKQTGIIFYTQASYTSKIDPLTGWRPNIYLKYAKADQAKKEILKFNKILFNSEADRYEFTYDTKNFSNAKEFPSKTIWTVCSCVERFRWNRKLNQNKGGYDHYQNLTDNFKELFKNYKIDHTDNILSQISELETRGNERFFKDFMFYFGLVCQIRNTHQEEKGDKNDFILSPVEPFFDSRRAEKYGKGLPGNGDENGAYNIARKGIILLKKISDFYDEHDTTDQLSWNELYVSHIDWDNFVTKN